MEKVVFAFVLVLSIATSYWVLSHAMDADYERQVDIHEQKAYDLERADDYERELLEQEKYLDELRALEYERANSEIVD